MKLKIIKTFDCLIGGRSSTSNICAPVWGTQLFPLFLSIKQPCRTWNFEEISTCHRATLLESKTCPGGNSSYLSQASKQPNRLTHHGGFKVAIFETTRKRRSNCVVNLTSWYDHISQLIRRKIIDSKMPYSINISFQIPWDLLCSSFSMRPQTGPQDNPMSIDELGHEQLVRPPKGSRPVTHRHRNGRNHTTKILTILN